MKVAIKVELKMTSHQAWHGLRNTRAQVTSRAGCSAHTGRRNSLRLDDTGQSCPHRQLPLTFLLT